MKFLIYGLVDPRTNLVRYVGKSSNGLQRPKAHWQHKHTRETRDYAHNWVRDVLSAGLLPSITVLKELESEENLNERERFWIAHYRKIPENKLTNQADGGGGCSGMKFPNRKGPSEEVRRRISQTLTGRKLSPERCKAIGEANKFKRGKKRSEEAKLRMSLAHKGKHQPPELVAKRTHSIKMTRIRKTAEAENSDKIFLFLDVDGVLNSHSWIQTHPERGFAHIDPSRVAIINRLVDKLNCLVVISSAWRILYSVPGLKRGLRYKGATFTKRIVGATDSTGSLRGDQIQRWMNSFPDHKLVILDDSTDMGHLLPLLVRTNPDTGIVDSDIQKAIAIIEAQ